MNFLRHPAFHRLLRTLRGSSIALALTAGVVSLASAQFSQTVLRNFSGLGYGGEPTGNVVFDHAGNIYGTTAFGGNDSGNIGCEGGRCGVVYELSPDGNGGWTEILLHLFSGGADGLQPRGLTFDSSGDLYGTTIAGGNASYCGGLGCGVVYKLSAASDGEWKMAVLYTFTGGADGAYPNPGLIFDSAGNLYGTAFSGGSSTTCPQGCGVVFELSKVQGKWREFVLHAFNGGEDGEGPAAPVVFDNAGNLYGTTYIGGKGGTGTIFELSQNSNRSWRESILHAFTGVGDGGGLNAGLILDSAGNLYGTTLFGGTGSCTACGTAFELSHTESGGWHEAILHSFTGKFGGDGAVPYAQLVFDASGNLYGTTELGGNTTCLEGTLECGVVFQLAPSESGWSESVVYAFSGRDGENPTAGLTIDASGNLYGTTPFGGSIRKGCLNGGFDTGCGVVFELVP